MIDYIKDKGIYISNYYNECNIVDCPIKEAFLVYEGNSYCLKHFIGIIQDDRCSKVDLKYLIDDIIIDKHLKIIPTEDIIKIHKLREKHLGKEEDKEK